MHLALEKKKKSNERYNEKPKKNLQMKENKKDYTS